MSEGRSDYTVGYRRPPKATQFKPGESGNSKGRPKGEKNTSTIWEEELNARIQIVENGKQKRISKRRAGVKQLANKAASGHLKAIEIVEGRMRERELTDASKASSFVALDGSADTLTIERIVRRIRLSNPELPASDPVGDTPTEPTPDAQQAPAEMQDETSESPSPELVIENPGATSQSEGDA